MVYLEQDAFMVELSKLYTDNKLSGSVWITMKRVERQIVTGQGKFDHEGPACIVHATDGKTKLACVVPSNQHAAFHLDLFTVIKAHTENLQKPKRIHKKKTNKDS